MSTQFNAYLVFGPESSGTRMITQALCAYGCAGSFQHEQEFDSFLLPPPVQHIVWRRSFPHAKQWPVTESFVNAVQNAGFTAVFVIVSRDFHSAVQSQIKWGHVQTEQQAKANIRKAQTMIMGAVSRYSEIEYRPITYLAFIQYWPSIMQNMFPELKQTSPFSTFNGNDKWHLTQQH